MKRDISLYFDDIKTSIERIEEYTNNLNFEQFLKDLKTQDAVARNIEIIGEAVKNIPNQTKEKYPNVTWREAAAMRDILIHDYPDVIPKIVWDTAMISIPKFKEQVLIVIKSEGF